MSSRRQLVSRARRNEDSSSRPRDSDATAQPAALPPYEPPSCPLTASAKRALDDLPENHDYSKYKKHLGATIANITNSIGDINERLAVRKQLVKRATDKRRAQGTEEEKTKIEIEAEQYAEGMEQNVRGLTTKAERALRDLIDYGDELAMRDTIMKDISENIATAPAPRPEIRRRRRPRSDGSDEDGENDELDEEEVPAADVPIVSAVELLNKAKENYAANYASKSMRARYDTNDYKQFKRTVHDAIHGPDAPPLPHARTWFPEDPEDETASSGRSRPADDGDGDEDDDVYIASATESLKCPLTLQLFKEPYSNHICNHTFEKSAILDYHAENGVVFVLPSQRARGATARQGPKQVRCPQVGCEAMLELKDFYDDQLRLRQVKRAAKETRGQLEDDDEEVAPRGTQRTRPAEVDEGDSVDVDEDRRKSIAAVKREQQSRDPSMAPSRAGDTSSEPDEDEADEMDAE